MGECSEKVIIQIAPSSFSYFDLPFENETDYLVIGDSKYCDTQIAPDTCKPTKDSIYLKFDFSANECQYTKQIHEANILSLTFKITTIPVINNDDNLLSYQCVHNYVTCNVTLEPTDATTSSAKSVNDTLITHDKVEATGLVDVIDLRIYDGDDYTNEINSSVSNNEYVFVEIGPSSKVDAYNVTATTCFATPGHSNPAESPTYFLIENGCKSTADPTADAIVVERNQDHSVRFKFKPFAWANLDYDPKLHIFCEYHVCVSELCQPSDAAPGPNRVPEVDCGSNLNFNKNNFATRVTSNSLKITEEN